MIDEAELRAIVDSELAEARKRVRARVEQVCGESESGVLAAGGMLSAILELAQQQAAAMADLIKTVGGSDCEGATALVGETSQQMRTFLSGVSDRLAQQNQSIDAATAAMHEILEAGDQIERVATASRFLALNAVIEANRLGEAGNISRAIAREMTELAQSVAKANAMVAKLARELAESMPKVAEGATELIGAVGGFRSKFDTQLGRVDRAFAAVTEHAQTAARETEGQLGSIMESTRVAIAALSFQDPMVQNLRGLGDVIEEARRRIGGKLGAETQPVAVPAAVGLAAGSIELF